MHIRRSTGVSNFSESSNADLANVLGNLVNRTIAMNKKYFDNVVVTSDATLPIDEELINVAIGAKSKVEQYMEELKVPEAIDEIFEIFRRANKYIDETTPWILAKEENKDRLKKVIYNLLESIRIGAVLLQPYLPDTADKIFKQLNTDNKYIESLNFKGLDYGIVLNQPEPLFVRIDKEAKLEEISNRT